MTPERNRKPGLIYTPSLTIAQPDTKPNESENENDVQFLSDEYDQLLKRLANV